MPKRRITPQVEPMQKKWLSAKEAKEYFGCKDDFLQRLRDEALVSFSRFGKMIWYELASIERFLEQHRVN